jgi:large subunit ribosomal protein L4
MSEESEKETARTRRSARPEEGIPEVSAGEIPVVTEEMAADKRKRASTKRAGGAATERKPESTPVELKAGEVPLFSAAGKRSGKIQLPERIFGETPNQAVMHQALLRQLANGRQGSADTRTRAEVSGGGAKPFRQKGLGRSRHGSTREPSMVGGGTVFGPHPRSYRQEMPRKMRRLALRSALSVKAGEGAVSVIEGFADLDVPKTGTMVETLRGVADAGRVLLVLPAANEVVFRSVRNLPWAKTIVAANLNLHDVFTHDHVVIARDALDLIEETFA